MSDTIRIKISDVERIRTSVDQAEKTIRQALASVDQAVQSADWQDSNRRKFEDTWKSARSAADFERSARELRSQLASVIARAKALGGQ